MGQIFNSFVGGEQAGRESGESRRRRNALEQAGAAYGAGDAEGAENALMSAGLVNEAGAYGALAEARRNRTNRTAISGAMTSLGPDATPQQTAQAGASEALRVGDTEQWAQFTQYANTLTQQDRENQAQRAQWLGSAAASLLGVPQEQRLERARALIANSPYQSDPHMHALVDDDASDLSDTALTSAANSSMGAADILAGRERQERYAVQDRQFNQQLAATRENRQLGAPQIRQFGNDYERGLNAISESIGPQITNAMPWALQVSRTGQVPQGTNTETALINDTGMLRAVARLQTGVGVLTEGEVRSTLGDNLANRLQQAGATINLDKALRPEVRQALATLVQSGVSRASQQAWQYRDNSIEEYRSVNNGQDPVGWGLPSLPHPQDMGSLRAAETLSQSNGQALRPNDVRVAPSGREYIYMGPGNWLPRGTGNTEGYLAGRDQRLAAGGAPTVSVGGAAPTTAGGLPDASQFQPNSVIRVNGVQYRKVNGSWQPVTQDRSSVVIQPVRGG